MATTNRQVATGSWSRLVILLGGDTLVFVIFALLGRSSHGLVDENPLLAAGRVAWPFFIGWLIVAPWMGVFRQQPPLRMLGLTLGAWLIALPVGLGLRWWQLGRSSPLSFAVVTFLTVAALLLIWRGAYSWWQTRQQV
ncbi:DUF3054 domain-containing protein [uncultured Chloroflexus sp.]|uniref:DUF3054 domain-containing protein n=1 Tax=uncultured Chloroflexus sp. TaxID=214040 RepID=UPI002633E54E|nr:DUF3054 domain-containing protein [uncultured Chloroflexus sp.]